ncbi:MAG: DUF1778 domain-containing protein [Moorea sp. SIO2B7]|nr:DUF1778 domain-containing protein [Moorena sp. SIO2B7]
MSTPTKPETDIIQLEISKEHKKALEKVADLRGLTLDKYLIEILRNAATETRLEPESIILSERDWEIVTSAIENPPELNPRLKAAIKRYRE